MIKEWNLLRFVACLSIVFLHSTTQTGISAGYPQTEFYNLARLLLCYATPTFIVLSEIILANRYPDRLGEEFFSKRIKWIYFPFVSFAIIDALVTFNLSGTIQLKDKVLDNVLFGMFEGYFVLIILQFYILHFLVIKFNIPMKILLPISYVVMFAHLHFLNYSELAFIKDNRHYLKLPFTAWFGYFTTGYLIGRHYKKVIDFSRKYKWYILTGLLVAVYFIAMNYKFGFTSVNSKRFDLFPFVILGSLAILTFGKFVPNSKIINTISNYSFGIYLLHWQVQRYVGPYTASFFEHTSTRVIGLFIISLILSMLIIKSISLLPFGSYIVGNIKRKNKSVRIPESQYGSVNHTVSR
ncbi:acyltransferase family protein [Bacillus sp. Marseille-Q3570]|uniref:acyltransferase family protein n=1 Tax=Bacillus sp. Marseille-Q3570 TaxID=2963522 RepID=UPI0021B79E72|nr:acyltransferase family protein [Bacillus sp. Marseille-Q3570]